MNLPCLYHHDSILREHCYSILTTPSRIHNDRLCQNPPFNQYVSDQTKAATLLSLDSLFQCDNTATLSSCWNWRNGVDDPGVNLVGAVEEVSEDDKISDAAVTGIEEYQKNSDYVCDKLDPSHTSLQCQHAQEHGVDHRVHNMDDTPRVCIPSTQTNETGCSLDQKVNMPLVTPHIASDNVSDQSGSSPQCEQLQLRHDPKTNEKLIKTPPSPFEEYVRSPIPHQDSNTLSHDSPHGVHEVDRNSSKEHADLIDILSITSDAETEFVHSENMESPQYHNARTNNSSMTKLSNGMDQHIQFTGTTEFCDIGSILKPALCHISKHSDTLNTESYIINSRQHEVDKRLKHGFFCQICRELFETVAILKNHVRCNHSPCDLAGLPALYQEVKCSLCKVEYFMCLYCCQTYFSIKRIIDHCNRHRTRSCFRCHVCSVKFFMSDRWHLFDHNIKPRCSICQPNITSLSEKPGLRDSSGDVNDFMMELEHSPNVKEPEEESELLLDGEELEEAEPDPLTGVEDPDVTEPVLLPDEMELDLPEEFMIENVMNWDPIVLLYRLPTASKSGEKEPASLTSDHHKCTHIPSQKNSLDNIHFSISITSNNPAVDAQRKISFGKAAKTEGISSSQTTSSFDSSVDAERGAILQTGGPTLRRRSYDKASKIEGNSSPTTSSCEQGVILRKRIRKIYISETPVPGHKANTTVQSTSSYDSNINGDSRGLALQIRHKCEYCGQSFSQENKYLEHVEIYHDYEIDHPNKTHQCHKCKKKFAFSRGLQQHVHGHYVKRQRCDYCKKIFSDERKFAVHRCIKM